MIYEIKGLFLVEWFSTGKSLLSTSNKMIVNGRVNINCLKIDKCSILFHK